MRIRAMTGFLKEVILSFRQNARKAAAISSGSGAEFLALRAARALWGLLSGWGHLRDSRCITNQ